MKESKKEAMETYATRLRVEMESITSEKKFKEVSKKLKNLSRRFGLDEITEGGVTFYAIESKKLLKGKNISIPKFLKSKDITEKQPTENEQIKEIRKKINKIFGDPEFKKLSGSLKRTIAQRFNMKNFEECGLALQAKAPTAMGGGSGGGEPYLKIYSYRFW
jgi:effector-binding domain-containing protein